MGSGLYYYIMSDSERYSDLTPPYSFTEYIRSPCLPDAFHFVRHGFKVYSAPVLMVQ